MNLKNQKPLISLALFSGIAYLLHKFSFYLFKISVASFQYSIEVLFIIFWYVHSDFYSPIKRRKSFDNVGCLSFRNKYQNGLCYLILKPILHIVTYNNTIEKVNFFGCLFFFVNRDCFNDTNIERKTINQ
jgi:hypothetical protein